MTSPDPQGMPVVDGWLRASFPPGAEPLVYDGTGSRPGFVRFVREGDVGEVQILPDGVSVAEARAYVGGAITAMRFIGGLGARRTAECFGSSPRPGAHSVTEAAIQRLHRIPGLRDVDGSWERGVVGRHGELVVESAEDVDDEIVLSICHRAGGEERRARVGVLPFPDDEDPERIAAYRHASFGILHVLLGLPVEDQLALPLEDWFFPAVLQDPANASTVSFGVALLREGPWRSRVDAWRAPVLPPALFAPRWVWLVVHALVLPGVVLAGRAAVALGFPPLTGRTAVFFPLVVHWFAQPRGEAARSVLRTTRLFVSYLCGLSLAALWMTGEMQSLDAVALLLVAGGIAGMEKLQPAGLNRR